MSYPEVCTARLSDEGGHTTALLSYYREVDTDIPQPRHRVTETVVIPQGLSPEDAYRAILEASGLHPTTLVDTSGERHIFFPPGWFENLASSFYS